MTKCDFGIDAHEIKGKVFTVPRDEVSDYARAYAEMLTYNFPAVMQVNHLREVIRYAREKPIKTGDVMHGQKGDWATCKKHLREWEEWKKRFPRERYRKGTEL
jgi:hypothetical protein